MSNAQRPPIPPKGGSQGPEPDYEKLVQDAIIHDPEIEDSDNISVKIKDGGLLGKDEMHLIGRVGSEKQKQRAQQLAASNTKRQVHIVNEIVVKE
jgi:hypothetical protein